MKVMIVVGATLLCAAQALAGLSPSVGLKTSVVEPAKGYNSWPMLQAMGDKLICVYRMGTRHNPGEKGCGTFARVSKDGGRTWGERVTVTNDPKCGETAIAKGLDDTGAALFWVRSYGPKPLFSLYRTTDGHRFDLISQPQLDKGPWMQVTDIFKVPTVGLMSFWFGGSYADDDRPRRWGVATSTDDGTNWTFRVVGANMKCAFWPTEPSGVSLGDGRILCVARTERGGRQLQLTSLDSGKTWKVEETNIRDVAASTPSLVYDSKTDFVYNYYYQRGKGILRCRKAKASAVFENPTAWPDSEILVDDRGVPAWDSGNANATTLGGRHYVTWYRGRNPDCEVVVAEIDVNAPCCGVNGVKVKTGENRPISPLDPGLTQVGRLRARGANEVGHSNWTIGCEVLDRDFANFWEYCEFIEPLGIKTVRLQAGWAKCEPKPGVFNFGWLDKIVDYLRGKGLEVILETSYGNPIYSGAGGWDLSGGIPTSEDGLAHWDVWVDTLSRHFAGRIAYWAMWNEPDNNRKVNTPERVAAFNLRTAKIIRRNDPSAKLQGLSLGGNDVPYFEGCLKALAASGDIDIFDTYIYHGYELAPEISYPMVEAKRQVLAKYSTKARLRQGENGCPSELIGMFALANTPWTEYSQAKWDMRRMLGDLGHGYESAVYTMSDFRHKGVSIRSPNNKGLIRVNDKRETIAVKRAYYAVQNVAGLFDAKTRLVGVPGGSSVATNSDITIAFYHYEKTAADGKAHPLLAFWSCGHTSGKWRDTKVAYDRPGDSFETRPTVIDWKGPSFVDPVWVDLLTGRVYEIPFDRMVVHSCGVTFVDIPVYDSPVVLTERAALEIDAR